MTQPFDRVLQEIATLYETEPRAEARETAAALRAACGQGQGGRPAPCALDGDIRSCLSQATNSVAVAVLAAMDQIPWGANPVASNMTPGAAAVIAVSTLLDPDGPINHPAFRLGLVYMRPGAYYPLHNHDADETYALIAGSALWTAGQDRRWRGAGEMIHHPSRMPHAFRTEAEGFVAVWRWSGDINTHSYAFLPDAEESPAPA
ncbi:MAG: cupin domain-containing protein [Cypionkella sp.]|nr:cupin domain-containing protein [Cypionkella sp.]